MPPRYSVKQTLDTAPTVSPPIQTQQDSGHFANKCVGHWLIEQEEELKARNSPGAARYHLSALLVASMCFTLRSQVTLHPR